MGLYEEVYGANPGAKHYECIPCGIYENAMNSTLELTLSDVHLDLYSEPEPIESYYEHNRDGGVIDGGCDDDYSEFDNDRE